MTGLTARLNGFFRAALIGYGVAFFSWYFNRALPTDPEAPGSAFMIGIGLVMQLLMLIVKWLVGRYEREHRMEGLKPAAVEVMQLVIDGVTVMLFAIATFRSIHVAAQM